VEVTVVGFGKQLFIGAVAGVASLALAPTWTLAASLLEFDANSITIQATDAAGNASAFGGLTHTGKLKFNKDGNSDLGLVVNGVNQSGVFTATFLDLVGEVSFVNGLSTGGSMFVKVRNADTSVDTYSFNIAAGDPLSKPVGAISFGLTGYQFDASTTAGFFNDANYGGVDVSPWFAGQVPSGLSGSFFQLKYTPDGQGFSDTSNVDILSTTAVPLPSAAAAGLGLIGALALVRRQPRKLAFAF